MPKIKVKGQTVQTGECPQTNGRHTHTHTHTHTDATKRIIAPATRSINRRNPVDTHCILFSVLLDGV